MRAAAKILTFYVFDPANREIAYLKEEKVEFEHRRAYLEVQEWML